MNPKEIIWHKVLDDKSELAAGRVMTVTAGHKTICLSHFESKKHSFLMSGYLGSIGFALPAAMGAWAAVRNKRPVIAVAGDGGFGQYMAELTTSVKYNMNIKIIVLNNHELEKISKEQMAGEWDVWQTQLHNPNFAEYATSCGALGIRVDKKSDLDSAMKNVLNFHGTALMEIMTDVKLI